MNEWWQSLSERDRKFISIGAPIVIVLLLYLFVWSPFETETNNLKSRVSYQQSLLTWMQQSSNKISTLKAEGFNRQARPSQTPLLSIVEQSVGQFQLHHFLTHAKTVGTGQVSLNFQSVPFDHLMQFLDSLWKTHNVVVQKSVIKKLKLPGMVGADFVISEQ